LESVTVSTMTWLRNDCCKWLWICCCCCSWLITGFVGRVTRQVPYMEHKLLTLVKHMCSPPVLCRVPVARSLVLYVMSSFVLFRLVIPSSLLLLLRNLVTPWYLHTFPTFIFSLVIDVKQFLNFLPFLKYFSDLTLLFGQLIILLFLCMWTLCFIIVCLTTCLNMFESSGIEPMLYFLKMYIKQLGYRDYATNLYK